MICEKIQFYSEMLFMRVIFKRFIGLNIFVFFYPAYRINQPQTRFNKRLIFNWSIAGFNPEFSIS